MTTPAEPLAGARRDWLALLAAPPRTPRRSLIAQLRAAGSPAACLGAEARRVPWSRIEAQEAALERHGIALVPCLSPLYPPALFELPRPPLALFCLGRIELLSQEAIALVGTRRPTLEGLALAGSMARAFARAGFGVTSGLARGVDGAAHRGALAAGGETVAVTGCGAEFAYPREHAELHALIAGRGLVASEAPPGTAPRAALFPQRNRLVAALSRAVVVVEAGARSGALITAREARSLGRPVFAVPGAPGAPESRGTNALLKRGEAGLVECAEDVLAALGRSAVPAPGRDPLEPDAAPPDAAGCRELLRLLGRAGAGVDALVRATGRPAAAVLRDLSRLQLEGRVRPLEGGTRWRLAAQNAPPPAPPGGSAP